MNPLNFAGKQFRGIRLKVVGFHISYACPKLQAGVYRFIVSEDDQFCVQHPNGTIEGDTRRWRHVSLSLEDRLPTYDELFDARKLFFPLSAEVIQVFPPIEEHVSYHPYCLHLWWCKDGRLTPPLMRHAIGPKVPKD